MGASVGFVDSFRSEVDFVGSLLRLRIFRCLFAQKERCHLPKHVSPGFSFHAVSSTVVALYGKESKVKFVSVACHHVVALLG